MTVQERFEIVKKMDEDVCSFNDETLWLHWISIGVPDCASDDDYMWFAEDEDEFNDLVRLYNKLKKKEMKG